MPSYDSLKRSERVKLQIRDKSGRWINMGGSAKFFSKTANKMQSGTIVGSDGVYAWLMPPIKNDTQRPTPYRVPLSALGMYTPKAKLDKRDKKTKDHEKAYQKELENFFEKANRSKNPNYVSNETRSKLIKQATSSKRNEEYVEVDPDGSNPKWIKRGKVNKSGTNDSLKKFHSDLRKMMDDDKESTTKITHGKNSVNVTLEAEKSPTANPSRRREAIISDEDGQEIMRISTHPDFKDSDTQNLLDHLDEMLSDENQDELVDIDKDGTPDVRDPEVSISDEQAKDPEVVAQVPEGIKVSTPTQNLIKKDGDLKEREKTETKPSPLDSAKTGDVFTQLDPLGRPTAITYTKNENGTYTLKNGNKPPKSISKAEMEKRIKGPAKVVPLKPKKDEPKAEPEIKDEIPEKLTPTTKVTTIPAKDDVVPEEMRSEDLPTIKVPKAKPESKPATDRKPIDMSNEELVDEAYNPAHSGSAKTAILKELVRRKNSETEEFDGPDLEPEMFIAAPNGDNIETNLKTQDGKLIQLGDVLYARRGKVLNEERTAEVGEPIITGKYDYVPTVVVGSDSNGRLRVVPVKPTTVYKETNTYVEGGGHRGKQEDLTLEGMLDLSHGGLVIQPNKLFTAPDGQHLQAALSNTPTVKRTHGHRGAHKRVGPEDRTTKESGTVYLADGSEVAIGDHIRFRSRSENAPRDKDGKILEHLGEIVGLNPSNSQVRVKLLGDEGKHLDYDVLLSTSIKNAVHADSEFNAPGRDAPTDGNYPKGLDPNLEYDAGGVPITKERAKQIEETNRRALSPEGTKDESMQYPLADLEETDKDLPDVSKDSVEPSGSGDGIEGLEDVDADLPDASPEPEPAPESNKLPDVAPEPAVHGPQPERKRSGKTDRDDARTQGGKGRMELPATEDQEREKTAQRIAQKKYAYESTQPYEAWMSRFSGNLRKKTFKNNEARSRYITENAPAGFTVTTENGGYARKISDSKWELKEGLGERTWRSTSGDRVRKFLNKEGEGAEYTSPSKRDYLFNMRQPTPEEQVARDVPKANPDLKVKVKDEGTFKRDADTQAWKSEDSNTELSDDEMTDKIVHSEASFEGFDDAASTLFTDPDTVVGLPTNMFYTQDPNDPQLINVFDYPTRSKFLIAASKRAKKQDAYDRESPLSKQISRDEFNKLVNQVGVESFDTNRFATTPKSIGDNSTDYLEGATSDDFFNNPDDLAVGTLVAGPMSKFVGEDVNSNMLFYKNEAGGWDVYADSEDGDNYLHDNNIGNADPMALDPVDSADMLIRQPTQKVSGVTPETFEGNKEIFDQDELSGDDLKKIMGQSANLDGINLDNSSVEELQGYLRDEHGFALQISGMVANKKRTFNLFSVDSSEYPGINDAVGTISQMLHKYPHMPKPDTLTVVEGTPLQAFMSSAGNGRVNLGINNTLSTPERRFHTGDNYSDHNNMPWAYSSDLKGIITHELGHALDAASHNNKNEFYLNQHSKQFAEPALAKFLGVSVDNLQGMSIKDIKDMLARRGAGYSGYQINSFDFKDLGDEGTGLDINWPEVFAEAFADVELNGSKSSDLNKFLWDILHRKSHKTHKTGATSWTPQEISDIIDQAHNDLEALSGETGEGNATT